MKEASVEYDAFNRAMDTILKADPKIVKQQMEQDVHNRAEARKLKRASLDRASIDQD